MPEFMEFDVYERVKTEYSCEKCSYHPKYVLVAMLNMSTMDGPAKRLFMTTNGSFYSSGLQYLHYWTLGLREPKCLQDFKKIKTIKGVN